MRAWRALPKLVFSWFTASLVAGVGPLLPGPGVELAPPAPGLLDQPLSHAVLYNVFWDPNWNRDLAASGLSTERITRFVRLLTNSGYFSGLKQYGVNSPRLAGTLSLVAACGSVAPKVVTPKQLAEFAECEAQSLHLPSNRGGSIIDIFLPPTTTKDYTVPVACLGSEGDGPPGLVNYHGTTVGNVVGPPLAYTAVSVGCALSDHGGTFGNAFRHLTWALSHELVEALTDPLPGQGWDYRPWAGNGEAADLCEPPTPPVTFSSGDVTPYWSNQAQSCIAPILSAGFDRHR